MGSGHWLMNLVSVHVSVNACGVLTVAVLVMFSVTVAVCVTVIRVVVTVDGFKVVVTVNGSVSPN